MEKTLVVMAAGMGSRFGGLKQIEPVGPNGEFIIDYSIYDAKRAGFTKVVFVIKEENYEDFKQTIGKRIEDKIQVEYAFQKNEDLPEGIKIPADRKKPLGTAHALYVTRNIVHESFAVISADDFYGREPFFLLSEFLDSSTDYCIIGYHIGATLTGNGSVKRGVCFEKNGALDSIIESKVEIIDNKIIGTPLDGRPEYIMEPDHPVSMLMYGLHPNIFSYLNNHIKEFFDQEEDKMNCEYLLPAVLDEMKHQGLVDLKIVKTSALWKGITYKEDLDSLKAHIKDLILSGEYSENLWS